MKVLKFGGASVKDAEAVKNLVAIIKGYIGFELVVVASAMGKTTNSLEKLTAEFYFNDADINILIQPIKTFHNDLASDLFGNSLHAIFQELDRIYEEIKNECLTLKRNEATYDFLYDQVVSQGEILSTTILSHFLNDRGIYAIWLDGRKMIKTDSQYREASVNWKKTASEVNKRITFSENCVYVTQGFIGSCDQDHVTTLGREGSDFTAAILANVLEAEEVVIWKDVPGLLNADPKFFSNTKKLNNISYHEAVELAYYGATVIHPKTIKPLQNKGIPLYVKPFAKWTEHGSLINDNTEADSLMPSYIFKTDQVLISIFSRDYSFISEKNLSEVFNQFARFHIKINLMENSAISFSACVDFDEHKLNGLTEALGTKYKVLYNKGVELMTVRHYDQQTLDQLIVNKDVLVEQRSRHTARYVMKNKG